MKNADLPQSPEERQTILAQLRASKMARSTHAYVRGNTAKFYEWLADSAAAQEIPAGPPVWICGDCHLGNLGPLADIDGRIDVQIRDLDQTVIGNPAHDLIRLGLSLASAARSSDLPGVTTAKMIEEMIIGYERALIDPAEGDAVAEPLAVRTVRGRALGRRWRHLAQERLEGIAPTIPLGRKFWALLPDERASLAAIFADRAVRRLILNLHGRGEDSAVELVDAAYWMKGCSSLGTLRFAALVRINDDKPGPLALIDLKEALASVAPAADNAEMPADHAERVVAGARALSPNLGDRMTATSMAGRPLVVRELMPQDLKLEVDQFSRGEAAKAARYLAHVVGLAHARQMDAPTRRSWRAELNRRHSGTLDAPSWLWSSVVSLVASHEAGYLQHCRQYAARL